MADAKTSALTSYSNPDAVNDVLPIVDNTNSTLKKISRNNLLGITSAPVGINDIQTLTQKTLTSPTIASPVLSGTITGTYTLAGTPTFPSSVATLTGSQTLTNKILTSPTINTPTITNASITADAITGFSSANTGTIYGVPITSGAINGSSLSQGTVAAAALATSAITLGYAQITASQAGIGATATQITGLTSTVTIPAGGRKIKITVMLQYALASSAGDLKLSIWDGVVNSGTQVGGTQTYAATTGVGYYMAACAIVTPAAGSKTYNAGFSSAAGTGTAGAAATTPAFILVEAI